MTDWLGEGVAKPPSLKCLNILEALFVDTLVDITISVASLLLLFFLISLDMLSSLYSLFSDSLLLWAYQSNAISLRAILLTIFIFRKDEYIFYWQVKSFIDAQSLKV